MSVHEGFLLRLHLHTLLLLLVSTYEIFQRVIISSEAKSHLHVQISPLMLLEPETQIAIDMLVHRCVYAFFLLLCPVVNCDTCTVIVKGLGLPVHA